MRYFSGRSRKLLRYGEQVRSIKQGRREPLLRPGRLQALRVGAGAGVSGGTEQAGSGEAVGLGHRLGDGFDELSDAAGLLRTKLPLAARGGQSADCFQFCLLVTFSAVAE